MTEEHKLALECLAQAQARIPASSDKLWEDIGSAFLEADRLTDAQGCLEHIRQSSGNSPAAFSFEAKLHQVRSLQKAAMHHVYASKVAKACTKYSSKIASSHRGHCLFLTLL